MEQLNASAANTLAQANNYTNTQVVNANAAVLGQAKTYTDAQTTEALNSAKTYADSGDAKTLDAAKTYTDQQIAGAMGADLSSFEQQTNARFDQQDKRIDRLGAMGEASSHMAMSAAGAGENGRLAAGVGFYNNQTALSVGYAKALGTRATFNIGAAFSSSEVSGGVGFGVDLH